MYEERVCTDKKLKRVFFCTALSLHLTVFLSKIGFPSQFKGKLILMGGGA